MANASPRRVPVESLKAFCQHSLERVGVEPTDAEITAEVLVAADLRGVASHGVARFRRYIDGLRAHIIVVNHAERVVTETLATATIDAGAGLGPPVSYRAMQKAVQKAAETGVGFVAVRNSNHFGIAGYYAMMALERDCVGLAMTNASPRVVPTFGHSAMLGTNPIAVAVPAGKARPFVLDMATSIVAEGKVEVADQLGIPILLGWAVDRDGLLTTDSHRTLRDLKSRAGAALLPLGGEGESLGGHKGYGLALWVEIFSALLSGAAFATRVYPTDLEGKPLPANLGHWFGAWRIDCFRPVPEFKADMDDLQALLKSAPKVQGQKRIYIPGEKEYEAVEQNTREGIPLNDSVWNDLRTLGQELGVRLD